MENKYNEIKLDISLLEDDLEMLEDKEMIKAYKTEGKICYLLKMMN